MIEQVKPENVGLSSSQLTRIGDWAQGYLDRGQLPFATTLVARHGKIAYVDQRGFADLGIEKPIQRDSVVRLFSMTKPVTIVAALMLYEQGLLQLDDPVSAYIPGFADLQVCIGGEADNLKTEPLLEPVRIWHLMTHTAGLTYGQRDEPLLGPVLSALGVDFHDPQKNLAEVVDALCQAPLKFQPGSRWNYGVSTDVLGRLIEVVSGQPLDEFFEQHIFAPLAMQDTGFTVKPGAEARFVSCYEATRDEPLALYDDAAGSALLQPRQMFSGGGGLVGTLDDYHRFCEMLRGQGAFGGSRLLGRKTVAMMASNWMPGDLSEMGQATFSEMPYDGIGFGLGVSVVVNPAKTRALYSEGEYAWGGMASTAFWIDPLEDLVVVFLTQVVPSSSYPLRRQLRALVNAAVID